MCQVYQKPASSAQEYHQLFMIQFKKDVNPILKFFDQDDEIMSKDLFHSLDFYDQLHQHLVCFSKLKDSCSKSKQMISQLHNVFNSPVDDIVLSKNKPTIFLNLNLLQHWTTIASQKRESFHQNFTIGTEDFNHKKARHIFNELAVLIYQIYSLFHSTFAVNSTSSYVSPVGHPNISTFSSKQSTIGLGSPFAKKKNDCHSSSTSNAKKQQTMACVTTKSHKDAIMNETILEYLSMGNNLLKWTKCASFLTVYHAKSRLLSHLTDLTIVIETIITPIPVIKFNRGLPKSTLPLKIMDQDVIPFPPYYIFATKKDSHIDRYISKLTEHYESSPPKTPFFVISLDNLMLHNAQPLVDFLISNIQPEKIHFCYYKIEQSEEEIRQGTKRNRCFANEMFIDFITSSSDAEEEPVLMSDVFEKTPIRFLNKTGTFNHNILQFCNAFLKCIINDESIEIFNHLDLKSLIIVVMNESFRLLDLKQYALDLFIPTVGVSHYFFRLLIFSLVLLLFCFAKVLDDEKDSIHSTNYEHLAQKVQDSIIKENFVLKEFSKESVSSLFDNLSFYLYI